MREFCSAYKVSPCETLRNVPNPIRYAKRDRVPQKKPIEKTIARMVFSIGAPAGTRIPDPLIKSQMLYRLSYRGV